MCHSGRIAMLRAAPTNNENRSATVNRCNAKALYSVLFSWSSTGAAQKKNNRTKKCLFLCYSFFCQYFSRLLGEHCRYGHEPNDRKMEARKIVAVKKLDL
jgi:hypothetical protein